MANLFIVNSDGSKTLVTKEQLVTFAQSGRINADSQVEVLGRVVAASKIKDLKPYFEAYESLTSGTTSASEPAPKETPSVPEETSNDETKTPTTDADIYGVASPPPSATDSSVPPIGASAMIPPSRTETTSTNTNIPAALDDSAEVSSIVDKKRVKTMARKRLGVFFFLCPVLVGLATLGFLFAGYDAYKQMNNAKLRANSTKSLVESKQSNIKKNELSAEIKQKEIEIEEKELESEREYFNRKLRTDNATVYNQMNYQNAKMIYQNAVIIYQNEKLQCQNEQSLCQNVEINYQHELLNIQNLKHKSILEFVIALLIAFLGYPIWRIPRIHTENAIRREIYQAEQIKFQQQLANVLTSKTL